MDKNRNAKPAEDQGVIVAGTDARARARGEVKDDDGKPRDVRNTPTENPPTGEKPPSGDERKGPPTPLVGEDVPSRPFEHDRRKPTHRRLTDVAGASAKPSVTKSNC